MPYLNTTKTLPGTNTAHGAKVVRINPPQHTDNSTRHTHEHGKDSQFCSGGNFGNVAYIIRLQIPYNNTLQQLYKGSLLFVII